jgi:hypothetical protein
MVAALVGCADASAQAIAPAAHLLPMRAEIGVESLRLPGAERLTLVGAGLALEVGENWWVGPAVYGAATGLRAGFFVGGLHVERRWSLGHGLKFDAALFAGGGGGGNAPVGSGLMLRPSIALLRQWDDLEFGVSISDVRFPSGNIHSPQFGLVAKWEGAYPYFDSSATGKQVIGSVRHGFGIDKVMATVGRYTLRGGSGINPELLGARAEWRDQSDDWHGGVEAAAAARGDAAGYMELLASLGWDHPFVFSLPSFRFGVRGAAGLGGGGGVPGGGGLIVKALGTLRARIAPQWQAGVEAGTIEGLHGRPNGRIAQVWIARELGSETDHGTLSACPCVSRYEWVATIEHIARATRKVGPAKSINTVGGSLNRFLDDSLYLTVQAHSAFAGGAGAFSTGLVGAGVATQSAAWRAGTELLAGAAGGGGVATIGGAIAQTSAWVERKLGVEGNLRLGVGIVRSAKQGLSSPTLQISWSEAFGLAGD